MYFLNDDVNENYKTYNNKVTNCDGIWFVVYTNK